ncbi:MAG: 50S ribosomal protein L23 [Candidatus Paceibacterota bacterium]
MAINIFGKKENTEAKEKPEASVKAEPKAKEPVKAAKVSAAKKTDTWKVLKFPHVTEKSSMLMGDNFYVFQVMDTANKPEIKKAIESEYNVKVVDVKIVNIPRKRVQRGRILGFKNGCKKAMVRLEKGQKIDIIAQ